MRFADHGDLAHGRMFGERLLDLAGIHVEPRDDDDVLGPFDERQPAVVVGDRDVAGVQPAVAVEHARRRLGVVPVAGEHVRTAHEHFARIAFEHVAAFGVDEPHLDTRQRWTDRPGARFLLDRARRHDRRRLGEPVALVHGDTEPGPHLLGDVGFERGRARHTQPHTGERVRGRVGLRERAPGGVHRGYRRDHGDAVALHARQRLGRMEVVDE